MWNAYAKWGRLKKAMRSRGLNPDSFSADELCDVLERRGITDRRLNAVLWEVISLLEPPPCYMTHCKHYGNSTEPCNCGAGKVPGRCKINRDYKARKKARKEAV